MSVLVLVVLFLVLVVLCLVLVRCDAPPPSSIPLTYPCHRAVMRQRHDRGLALKSPRTALLDLRHLTLADFLRQSSLHGLRQVRGIAGGPPQQRV